MLSFLAQPIRRLIFAALAECPHFCALSLQDSIIEASRSLITISVQINYTVNSRYSRSTKTSSSSQQPRTRSASPHTTRTIALNTEYSDLRNSNSNLLARHAET
ncbi:uncharacterized protein EURHEDRAFT_132700 [Aspergillus ruber CBS 135680]|uniref:Uncharacterized protein n=1 Tax=Aspergillus ruber (strain CBS 135680) TaxID=1388766 RepID=A0A017SQH6_ASPRC|nr:uncharacterized protein EURHEDRAFT_132700 [Aspergillus ruber CBS 135680]EYE99217.1 hypothetical protein EURHEDRAFT_132700 [Aspergillus ruber CBS 135680]